jgi:hypothetical protein
MIEIWKVKKAMDVHRIPSFPFIQLCYKQTYKTETLKYVSVYVCIHVSMYLCVYVSMYVHMYVCTYKHTHIRSTASCHGVSAVLQAVIQD